MLVDLYVVWRIICTRITPHEARTIPNNEVLFSIGVYKYSTYSVVYRLIMGMHVVPAWPANAIVNPNNTSS